MHMYIAGVDEVGRGPLAGPVIAAAVILNPKKRIRGLKDSKLLLPKRRDALFEEISEKGLGVAVGRAEVFEIDQYNILKASLLAMKRAIEGLSVILVPHKVLVDGPYVPDIIYPSEAIIGGDNLKACISAASIIAKVTRDREMIALCKKYPGYGFSKHKGYGTEEHLKAIRALGKTEIHRKSFMKQLSEHHEYETN